MAATQPPGGGGNAGVCGIVAGAEVATLVGKQLAQSTPNAAMSTCTWSFADGGTVVLTADPSNTDTSLAIAKQSYSDGEEVTGLGERAWWARNQSMLIFVKGMVYTVKSTTTDSKPRRRISRRRSPDSC